MWDPHVSCLFFLLSSLLSSCLFLLRLHLPTKVQAPAPPPPPDGHLHHPPCAKTGSTAGRNTARRSSRRHPCVMARSAPAAPRSKGRHQPRPGARAAASRAPWPGARAAAPRTTGRREPGAMARSSGIGRQGAPIGPSPSPAWRTPPFTPRNAAAEPPPFTWLATWPPASYRRRSSGRARVLLRAHCFF